METAETAVDIPPGNVELRDFVLLVNGKGWIKKHRASWFVSF